MCTNTIDVWNGGGEAITSIWMRETNRSNKKKLRCRRQRDESKNRKKKKAEQGGDHEKK
jgi:hypothetical protein